MSRAIADTSVFVAQESGRELGDLPEQIAVSVVTLPSWNWECFGPRPGYPRHPPGDALKGSGDLRAASR